MRNYENWMEISVPDYEAKENGCKYVWRKRYYGLSRKECKRKYALVKIITKAWIKIHNAFSKRKYVFHTDSQGNFWTKGIRYVIPARYSVIFVCNDEEGLKRWDEYMKESE